MKNVPLLLFVLPSVLLTTLVTWRSQLPFTGTTLPVVEPRLNCEQPPHFRTGYQREENGVSNSGHGFDFQGLAWIQGVVCTPGILTITAEGEVAANEAPELQISLGADLLLQEHFEELRSIKLRVPRAGRLILGYFNDYYRSEARVATLEAFKFSGAGCETFKVEVPQETGGTWNEASGSASLVSNVPMTIWPCSAGNLSFRVVGRPGQRVFPKLVFYQNNVVLGTVVTSAQRQVVSLRVTDKPVSLTLSNPYFKQLADRNLKIRSLEFTPDLSNSP